MMNTLFANSYGALPLGMGMGLFAFSAVLFFLLMLAIIALKGYALWNAAKRNEIPWFVALLLLNTLGILELIYLYFIVKKWRKQTPNTDSSTPVTPTGTDSSAQ